jgi:hypothetical protein
MFQEDITPAREGRVLENLSGDATDVTCAAYGFHFRKVFQGRF